MQPRDSRDTTGAATAATAIRPQRHRPPRLPPDPPSDRDPTVTRLGVTCSPRRPPACRQPAGHPLPHVRAETKALHRNRIRQRVRLREFPARAAKFKIRNSPDKTKRRESAPPAAEFTPAAHRVGHGPTPSPRAPFRPVAERAVFLEQSYSYNSKRPHSSGRATVDAAASIRPRNSE